jgi:hypothetical protein
VLVLGAGGGFRYRGFDFGVAIGCDLILADSSEYNGRIRRPWIGLVAGFRAFGSDFGTGEN